MDIYCASWFGLGFGTILPIVPQEQVTNQQLSQRMCHLQIYFSRVDIWLLPTYRIAFIFYHFPPEHRHRHTRYMCVVLLTKLEGKV